MKFKKIKQRGQVMVLWALLTLICFVPLIGAGMDLGWYYLNVSRLQNAADAAALAGAKTLENKSFATFGTHYYATSLITKAPDNIELGVLEYENIVKEKVNITGLEKYRSAAEVKEAIIASRDEVEKYTRVNLYDTTAVESPTKSTQTISATDTWSTSAKNSGKIVNGTVNLFIERTKLRNDVYGPMYYQVVLEENVSHLFLRGFDPMKAKVAATALLKHHDIDLLTKMSKLEDTTVMKNWEIQNESRKKGITPYVGNWNHFQRADKKIYYTDGDVVRREDIQIKSGGKNGTARPTDANGNKQWDDKDLDSINIDYKQDVYLDKTGFTTDWDLGVALPSPVTSIQARGYSNWSTSKAFDLRIHSYVDFDKPWPTRYPQASKPDILWARIESDPYYWNLGGEIEKTMQELNSVRQIFLNFNSPNTQTYPSGSTNGLEGAYMYRPLFIYYMGPEKLEKNDTTKRVSQPLVLNFNTDYNAVIFAPNSPVVINGNEHKFTGFVIAKKFVKSVEAGDYKKVVTRLDTNKEVYIEPTYKTYDNNKDVLKSIGKDEEIPTGNIEVTYPDGDSDKKYYINEDCACYYKIVETSPIKCTEHNKQHENTFFVDAKGNLQVKDLPDGSTRKRNDQEKIENGHYIKNPDVEVVYKLAAFNLSSASYYSAFEEETLTRKIYKYLDNYLNPNLDNSVDMFFTTERSAWID